MQSIDASMSHWAHSLMPFFDRRGIVPGIWGRSRHKS
jgi:hypothetical protein